MRYYLRLVFLFFCMTYCIFGMGSCFAAEDIHNEEAIIDLNGSLIQAPPDSDFSEDVFSKPDIFIENPEFEQNDEEGVAENEDVFGQEFSDEEVAFFKEVKEKTQEKEKTSTIDQDQKLILTLSGKSIPITNIIESFFSERSLVELAQENFKPTEKNKVRSGMAAKWVKNASTRIFQDKWRSILELVLNGCDSYYKEGTVGKFGMGFFSTLALLTHEETNGAIINIETCYRAKDNQLYAYKISFEHKDEQIVAKFEQSSINDIGTKVSIIPKNSDKHFSKDSLNSIRQYIHYLDFYDKAYVGLNPGEQQIGEGYPNDQKRVICNILPETISIQDFGSGIPIDVTLTKLLVPSSSTKGVDYQAIKQEQDGVLKEAVPTIHFVETEAKKTTTPHFLIGVNGVVVVMVDIKDKNLGDKDIYLSMPQITKLTLARNEISLSREGCFEEEYIKKVIAATIEEVLLGINHNDAKLLAATYKGLKRWEETSASNIKGRFSIYFKDKLREALENNRNIIPVPIEYYNNFSCILKNTARSKILLPIDGDLIDYNYMTLENFLAEDQKSKIAADQSEFKSTLQKAINKELIAGLHLSFVEDCCLPQKPFDEKPKLSFFDLKNHLFIPRSILQETTDNTKDVASFETDLVDAIVIDNGQYDLVAYDDGDKYNDASVIYSNMGKFREDSYYDWRWLQEPINGGFFTAEGKFSFFNETHDDLLQKFFEKHKEMFLDEDLMGVICPYRGAIFAADNAEEFLNSQEFLDDILKRLNWHRSGYRFYKFYFRGFNITLRKDLYYILYDKDEKDFFVSSVKLDNIFSLGYDTPYFSYFPYAISKSRDFIAKEADAEDCFLSSCDLFSREMGDKESRKDFFLELPEEEKKECLVEKFVFNISEYFYSPHCFLMSKEELHKAGLSYFYLDRLDAEEMEIIEMARKNLKNYLVSHRKTLKMHNFMNNLFGSLLLPFNDNQEISCDGHAGIFANGKQLWPIEGEITLEKLDDLFLNLLYHNLYNRDRSEHGDEKTLPYEKNDVLNKNVPSVVLSFPGSDKNSLHELEKWFKDNYLGWLVSRSGTLKDALPSLNIYLPIIDLFQWYKTNNREDGLSDETKKLVSRLHDACFGLYNKYFNIPATSFHKDYVGNLQIDIINPDKDMENNKSVFDLICCLEENPSLLKKLVDFQIIDFNFKTDTLSRDDDLKNNKFYVHSILSNTPISVLALLLEKNVDKKIITAILEEARTPEELMYISYTIFANNFYNSCQVASGAKENLAFSIRLVMQHSLRDKMGLKAVSDLYNQNKIMPSIKGRIELAEKESLVTAIVQFLETVLTDTNFISERSGLSRLEIKDDNDESTFNLTQLLSAHMRGEGLVEDLASYKLDAVIREIQSQKLNLGLGKISQSIEDNDEKNPIQSTVTETVQNSIDAISGFIAKGYNDKNSSSANDLTKIEYKVDWMSDIDANEGYSHTCLTARDFIGFPSLKTLLTDFLLPDYNNKGAEDIGEMGNGSQKMYKNAEKVLVLTKITEDPSKAYLLDITPISDSTTGHVYDLQIKCLDVSHEVPDDFFGTSIRVLFKSKPAKETKMDILMLVNFFRTFMSALSIELPGNDYIDIFLNGDPCNDKKSNEIFLEKPNAVSGDYKFRIRRLNNELMSSLVTAGGIPFATFNSFVENHTKLPKSLLSLLSFGFVLDISKDVYEPVVSRNDLQMSSETEREWNRFLFDSCYVKGLLVDEKKDGFLDSNFLHFGSTSKLFNQMLLDAKDHKKVQEGIGEILSLENSMAGIEADNRKVDFDQGDFFTYYNSPLIGKSFYDEISNAYTGLVEKLEAEKKRLQEVLTKARDDLLEEVDKELTAIEEESTRTTKIAEAKNKHNALYNDYNERLISYRDDEFNNWKLSLIRDKYGLIDNIVIPWVEKKKENFQLTHRNFNPDSKESLKTENEKETEANLEESFVRKQDSSYSAVTPANVPVIKDFLKEALSLYGNLYLEKIHVDKSHLSSIDLYYKAHDEMRGYYGNNEIYLNLYYLKIRDFLRAMVQLLDKDDKKCVFR